MNAAPLASLEDRLLGEIEPLRAWLREPYAVSDWQFALDEAWRRLRSGELEGLPALIDALRRQVLAEAGLQSAQLRGGRGFPVFADDSSFTLFNPLPLPRSGWQTLSLLLQGPRPAAVRVLDAEGTPLPLRWWGARHECAWREPLDAAAAAVVGERLELLLACPLQGLEALALNLEACEPDVVGAARLDPAQAPPVASPCDDAARARLLRRRPLLALCGQRSAAWREPLELPDARLLPLRLRPLPGRGLELELLNAGEEALGLALPSWQAVDGARLAPGQRGRWRRPA